MGHFDMTQHEVQQLIEKFINEGVSGMFINTELLSFENEKQVVTWIIELGHKASLGKDVIRVVFKPREDQSTHEE